MIKPPPEGFMTLTIVGSGVSTGVPVIGHFGFECACADAIQNPSGPNARNNVSLLITIRLSREEIDAARRTDTPVNMIDGIPVKQILIDCGKTFRDAYFKVLRKHSLEYVDALLITHDHADAIGGLDDLRDLQPMSVLKGQWYVDRYIATFLQDSTLQSLRLQVGYIIRNSVEGGKINGPRDKRFSPLQSGPSECTTKGMEKYDMAKNIGVRRSTALEYFSLPDDRAVSFSLPSVDNLDTENSVCSPQFYSVPVFHGSDYIALGFVFGSGVAFRSSGVTRESLNGKTCVVYLSDISGLPETSRAFLLDLVKIDILYVDMLLGRKCSHPTHYCMDDALELIQLLQPTCTYGIGLGCQIEYNKGTSVLKEAYNSMISSGVLKKESVKSIELGYDGLSLSLPL